MNRRTTTSNLFSLIQLWIYLGCFSSSLAQLTQDQLRNMCDSITTLEAVDGADSSIMIDCNHGPGGLISLNWVQMRNGAEETPITIDEDKYEDTSPSVRINRVTASDEGLYVCKVMLSGNSGVTMLNAGCLFVFAKASYRDCPGQPSSTPCQETIESIPGMVTFNTRVDFTGGGSLNLTQEIKRLQLYRGTGRFAANLLYACDTNSVECTNSGNAIVIQGDPELKYDISVQLQLTESDSGTYTAFLDAFDPISGSDVESSKSFTVEISMPTASPSSSPTPNTAPPTSEALNQETGGDNTTVIAVVVPLSIILVALLVIAVIAVTYIVVKHNNSRRYELSEDTEYEKNRHSIIDVVPELEGLAATSKTESV